MEVYSDNVIFIEVHESEIPWLKIFTKRKIKEFSEANGEERMVIWQALDIIERTMLAHFKPEKINIAQFGNYLPHLHWHIMARFKDDSFFPEPMWGEKQREGQAHLDGMPAFLETVQNELKSLRP